MIDLLKKLQFKDQPEFLILNHPEELNDEVAEIIKEIPVHNQIKNDHYGFALIFVKQKSDIDGYLNLCIDIAGRDQLLWFAYPKKTSKKYKSDITRDQGWELLSENNILGIRMISINEDWSAMRFRSEKFSNRKK